MSMYITSVSKKYSNSSGRVKKRIRPRKVKTVYFYDENGKFTSKTNLSTFKFLYYKYFKIKWRRRKFLCPECGKKFTGLISIISKEVDCPYCPIN